MIVDPTVIISTTITSVINGIIMFLVLRYTAKAVDKIEKLTDKKKKDE